MKSETTKVSARRLQHSRGKMNGMQAAIFAACMCVGAAILTIPAGAQTQPAGAPAAQSNQQTTPAPAQMEQQKQEELRKPTQPIRKKPVKHSSAAEKKKPGTKAARKKTDTKEHAETKANHANGKKAEGQPPTIVVRHGGVKDPKLEITPAESRQQAAKTSRSTAELLSSTGQNLHLLSKRKLTPQQQDIVGQIRNYVAQATAAQESGDVERAQSFASKAQQLSDDMVKH
jgi:outer membrane biosynthesis protein TonB